MRSRIAIVVSALAALGGGWIGYAIGSARPAPTRGPAHVSAAPEPAVSLVVLAASDYPAPFADGERKMFADAEAALGAGDLASMFAVLGAIEDAAQWQRAVLELIGRLDAAQIAALVANPELAPRVFGLQSGLNLGENLVVSLSLIDRWVDLDTEAAAAHILGKSSFEDFDGVTALAVLAFVSRRDSERGMRLLEQMRAAHPEPFDDLLGIVYLGVAFDDPARAVRLFVEQGGLERGDPDPVEDIFELLAGRAGDALDEVLALPRGEVRASMLPELFEAWSDSDPRAALDAALALRGDDDPAGAILRNALVSMAPRDPQAALAALHLVSKETRGPTRDEILKRWTDRDPAGALDWARANLEGAGFADAVAKAAGKVSPELGLRLVEQMSDSERAAFAGQTSLGDGGHFVHRLAAVDPAAAVGWLEDLGMIDGDAESNPDRHSRFTAFNELQQAGSRIGEAAARSDFATARDLLASLPPGQFREGFFGAMARQGAQADPGEASDWALGLEGKDRGAALVAVGQMMAESDPAAAADWALGVGEPDALKGVLAGWGELDAEAAYRWAVQSDPDQSAEEIATLIDESQLLNDWTRDDPRSAAEAMLGFPKDMAPQKLGFVIDSWARHEPGAVGEFIDGNLEPGPVRDAAVEALVGQLKESDLSAAAAWARTIGDEGRMYQVLESLATQ